MVKYREMSQGWKWLKCAKDVIYLGWSGWRGGNFKLWKAWVAWALSSLLWPWWMAELKQLFPRAGQEDDSGLAPEDKSFLQKDSAPKQHETTWNNIQ